MAKATFASIHASQKANRVRLIDVLFTLRAVASERPIPSRMMIQRVKISKELAKDESALGVSLGFRKNPRFVGVGLWGLKCSVSPKSTTSTTMTDPSTETRF